MQIKSKQTKIDHFEAMLSNYCLINQYVQLHVQNYICHTQLSVSIDLSIYVKVILIVIML